MEGIRGDVRHITPESERPVVEERLLIAAPDEKERRSGPVLPAEDEIGAEGFQVEVRIAERIVRRPIAISVDLV